MELLAGGSRCYSKQTLAQITDGVGLKAWHRLATSMCKSIRTIHNIGNSDSWMVLVGLHMMLVMSECLCVV